MRKQTWLPRELRLSLIPGALITALAGAVLWVIGSLPHSRTVSALIMSLGWIVATCSWWLVRDSGQRAERALWVSDARQEAAAPAALDYRLIRLRRDLRDALERDDRPDEIYPLMRRLTAERLHAHHGIDLEDEPERAKDAMTPALWRYLSRPPTDTAKRSANALHTAIEGIEKL